MIEAGDAFLAYALTYDGQHPLVAHEFGYPALVPPVPGQVVDVSADVYAGFCPTGVAAVDWRGPGAVIEALGEAAER